MELPFSKAEFFTVFASYNTAIWPLQIVATFLGALAILLLFWRPDWADRAIATVLSIFWIGMAAGYHWSFFTEINNAAYLFGGLFLVGAGVFLVEGTVGNRIQFSPGANTSFCWLAGLLILYGLIIYPLLGLWQTHPYPETPLFGVAPCPTTIFTLAVLILATHPRPIMLAAAPMIWGLIGGSAAFLLNVPQDWGLIVAALVWIAWYFANLRASRPGAES